MIVVDLFVPSVYKNYNFQLDENVSINLIIEEIVEMICQKENSGIMGNVNNLLLCDKQTERVLDKNKTLSECRIVTGSNLMLV